MAGEVCPKCGQVIKPGEKIIWVGGRPTHYLICPPIHKSSEVPKPSEVFSPSEKHKCFAGDHYFSPHSATTCSVCGWLVCSVCGKCACDLSREAREAIEAVWETFCINCRFKPHPLSEKIPLNLFLVWKAFSESAKKCASTLGVTVYDKTYMPKIAECVAERMKGTTADIIKSQHPEWVEEYKTLYP